MMEQEAARLNNLIKQSPEYLDYVRAKQAVMANRELYDAMNSFRRRNYDLQSYDDGINRFNEITGLTNEYERILKEPVVSDFLVAEQVLTRKLQSVYELISEGLDLDYSYME